MNMSETSDANYDYDGGGGTTNNAIIPSPAGHPSPGQKLLSSMVLGDGSFEASMKERSRVSVCFHMRRAYCVMKIHLHISILSTRTSLTFPYSQLVHIDIHSNR
jgi:hypothetical protein